jgi:carboxyl-terminal processing protease
MQMRTTKLVMLSVVFGVVALWQQFTCAAEGNEVDVNTLTARQTSHLEETLIDGSFSGIGINIANHKDGLLVTRVLSGGGAEKAGLKAGEMITSIEKRSTSGMSLEQAVSLLTGPVGTKVNLTVRDTNGKSRDISVERGTVIWLGFECREVKDGVWLVRISAVNKRSVASFRAEVEKLEKGAAKGLILDIRGDKGGHYPAIVEITNMFVPKGRIMWLYKPKNGDMEEVRADGNQVVTIPVAVIVGKDTTGCELIAAALKRNRRAKLIGEKTSGLAAKRDLVKKNDGSNEKVVLGTFFYSPLVPITGKGIRPDIEFDGSLSEQEIIAKAIETLKLGTNDKL